MAKLNKQESEMHNFDPLYDQAVAFTKTKKQISASMIQRQVRIGYDRATRYLHRMEQVKLIVAPGKNGGDLYKVIAK